LKPFLLLDLTLYLRHQNGAQSRQLFPLVAALRSGRTADKVCGDKEFARSVLSEIRAGGGNDSEQCFGQID
jgi:hypothetical protein